MKSSECEHENFKKKEVTLSDGFSYYYYQCENCAKVDYPLSQAQKLLDYSKDHVFFFVEDWILAWMATGDRAPIPGITMLQKQMVIIIFEFAQEHNIASENPGFRAYKFGPYTERIDRALQNLSDDGLIYSEGRLNTNSERFYLTDAGAEKGEQLLRKLTKEQREDLEALRRDLQQYTLQGIETRVYKDYPEYTDQSLIYKRVLHRRRK